MSATASYHSYPREPEISHPCLSRWFRPMIQNLTYFEPFSIGMVPQFAGNAHWAEPSPPLAYRARPLHSSVKRSTWCFHWEETAIRAVVGSIVWAFRRLKKPRCREMSARGYELHSVPLSLPLSFFPVGNGYLAR